MKYNTAEQAAEIFGEKQVETDLDNTAEQAAASVLGLTSRSRSWYGQDKAVFPNESYKICVTRTIEVFLLETIAYVRP